MTRTMIADSKIPLDFWGEAAYTAAHIRNRSKSTVHGKTPYEMWNERRPNIKYMRKFGCMAYLLDKEERRNKFDSKIIKGIFVGLQLIIHTGCTFQKQEESKRIVMLNLMRAKTDMN